ncbi:MAG TPA: HPr family phosphocarrier protein [Candidatus Paceibacterota bacterium]|nr:HPr family phosphocarrier protein [Verrucomicrobiota bacterium]HRZ43830.1 HPr family phosphocarrier protein [Candidatus Paceibacterota bacterium]
MCNEAGAANPSPQLGIRIRCPKCGSLRIPKDQELARSILDSGSGLGMKCPECQCEFMYDRERGEISVIEERGPSETDSRESGHPNEWGHLLRRLGRLARREGRLEDAERLTRQAIDRFEAAGDERSVCGAKGDLALVLEARGDPAAALELHRDSGGMARKLGAMDELQHSLGNQAAILADIGQVDRAVELLAEQEEICRQTSNERGLAQGILNQGILKIRALHRTEEGLSQLADGCRRCLQHRLQPPVQQALLVLRCTAAELATPILQGQLPQAQEPALRLLAELRQYGLEFCEPDVLVWTTQALAQLELLSGNRSEAQRMIETSLADCRRQQWQEPLPRLEQLQSQVNEILGPWDASADATARGAVPLSWIFKSRDRIPAGASFRYWVVHPEGLTATMCAQIVKRLAQLPGDIRIEKDGESVNGKSIMGLMMLAAGPGSSIQIQFSESQDGHALDPLAQKGIIVPEGTDASFRCPKCARENQVPARPLSKERVCPACGEPSRFQEGDYGVISGGDCGSNSYDSRPPSL